MSLRDIAANLDVTERTVTAIIRDLAEAGYVIKHREGRRNRYEIRRDAPLLDPSPDQPTIGQLIRALDNVEPAADGQATP